MINFTIKPELETLEIESDGITWSSYTNWDGHRQLLHDSLSINEAPWNDEMTIIIKEIKNRLKSERQLEAKKANEVMNSLGNDVGKKSYRFDLDNRLFFLMKEKNIVISKFINEAIREKLERN
jgi:hypothetical protein